MKSIVAQPLSLFTLLLSLLGCANAHLIHRSPASTKQSLATQIQQLKCYKETASLLKDRKSLNDWRENATSEGTRMISTPTEKIGKWIDIFFNKDQILKTRFADTKKSISYEFNENCQKQKLIRSHKKIKESKKIFKDKDLVKLLEKNRKGIIYVWSPTFTYSVHFLKQYKVIAKNRGFHFSALLAKNAPKEWINSSKIQKTLLPEYQQRNFSFELSKREAELHSPTTFIYKNGKIIENLVGVYPPFHLMASLRRAEQQQ